MKLAELVAAALWVFIATSCMNPAKTVAHADTMTSINSTPGTPLSTRTPKR